MTATAISTRSTRLLLAGAVALVATLLPAVAQPDEVEAQTRDFGSTPFDDVVNAAGQHHACGLSRNKLAAMMIAVTYPETGSTGTGNSPSPMTLSRWDNQSALYSFGNSSSFRDAFWHPGIGMFQFDSAGGWPMHAGERINTASSANQAAATMTQRYCSNNSRAYAWGPWFGCGSGTCESIYQQIYDASRDRVRNIVRDHGVGRGGGMLQRTCTTPSRGTFPCWYVDPNRAQGSRTFLASHFGPTPVTAPFYTFSHNGQEQRHWLRADTGYTSGIRAGRPLGANARTSLNWESGEVLCDLTASRGACTPTAQGTFDDRSVAVTGALQPLVGDFDNNGREQVFLYNPNGSNDRLVNFASNGTASVVNQAVSGAYQPFVGDFDGDGRDDIFWYAPGSAPDYIWFGSSSGGFTSQSITVNGTYQPVVGDFNGNGRTSVLWYAPGFAPDALWSWSTGRGLSSRPLEINNRYDEVLVGDFDGTGRDDIFWYRAGPFSDWTWFGGPTEGQFTNRRNDVSRSYTPFVGDFDGDNHDDIFWYRAGPTPTSVWYGQANRTYASVAHNVSGDYTVAVGDYWGDGDSILWYDPGPGASHLWKGRSNRTFTPSQQSIAGGFDPVVGNVDGQVGDDIFWYGSSQSRLWQSR